MSRRRLTTVLAALLLLIAFALVALGYCNATSDPLVRRASISLPGWPRGVTPINVVLISDVHVIAPDMPPARVRGIVASINALQPDIVFIAGDFVSDRVVATGHFDDWSSIAPLAGLRPRFATVAVLGNNDHERGIAGIRRALKRARLLLLKDDARRIGPLIVGGTDDPVTQHEDFELMVARTRALGSGPRVILSHGPALFPFMPADFSLLLAGHTHCGQINLAWLPRANLHCGIERKDHQEMVTSAGLGASIVPLRYNASPDIWLLHLGP